MHQKEKPHAADLFIAIRIVEASASEMFVVLIKELRHCELVSTPPNSLAYLASYVSS